MIKLGIVRIIKSLATEWETFTFGYEFISLIGMWKYCAICPHASYFENKVF
jgi:hypothetical protein